MANRNHDKLWALGNDRVEIAGRFRPNGTGAVDNALNKGLGFTVARTGVGAFLLTLQDRYNDLEHSHADVMLAAVADLRGQIGAVEVQTAGTVEINILAGAVPTDIADDPDNWVTFKLRLKNTNVQP